MKEELKKLIIKEIKTLLKEQSQYELYCDMDGVLTDFQGPFMKISGGLNPQEYEAKHGTKEFWKLVGTKGEEFWSKMPWMADGKALWSYIKPYKPNILSAPSYDPKSSSGKHKWIGSNLSGYNKVILVNASAKQQYASPNAILIDDRKRNIAQWQAAGGIGILHRSASDSIKQLQKYLGK
jgi:hypothetical protein